MVHLGFPIRQLQCWSIAPSEAVAAAYSIGRSVNSINIDVGTHRRSVRFDANDGHRLRASLVPLVLRRRP